MTVLWWLHFLSDLYKNLYLYSSTQGYLRYFISSFCVIVFRSKMAVEKFGLGCAFHWKIILLSLFLTEITVKINNHRHIRDQQVKIYKNPCFVFDFTSLEFLTVFSTAVSTGSWWRRKLKWNTKPSFNSIYSNFQFQENRIKTVAVRVRAWRVEHITVVTSSNMLMSQITNAHN